MLPDIAPQAAGIRYPISSTPRGATDTRSPPPGFFSGLCAKVFQAGQESAMNEDSTGTTARRLATRIAALIAGVVVVLALGAPWLLNDAPPSPEAVVAAKACCASAPAPAIRTPAPIAPAAH